MTWPRQNAKFWRDKIVRNRARDRLVTRTLRARGWRVARIWEHDLLRRNSRGFKILTQRDISR